MASDSGSETRTKESNTTIDKDFQWGKMPLQDLSGQLTRSMVEMRKPKAYELSDVPSWSNHTKTEPINTQLKVPSCPTTLHTIKLLRYIKQAQSLISKLEDRSHTTYNYGASIAKLPQIPVFEEEKASAMRRSRSSSSGVSLDTEDKSIFSAPDPESTFRSGLKTADFPQLDDETTSRILKKSVATVAAHAGYEESTATSLNVLTGVADTFMTSFSKCLRDILDSEAETGRTAFYDAVDQVLHESGLSGLKDIEEYWQTRIIKRHKILLNQSDKLSKKLQSMKYPKPSDTSRQIKHERVQSCTTTYGKWTPVTGMSSSPYPSGRTIDTTSGPSWASQPMKQEPQDNNCYSTQGTSQQEYIRVKSEYSGFESSMDMFKTEKTEGSFGLDSFYTSDDYRPAKKKTRNM